MTRRRIASYSFVASLVAILSVSALACDKPGATEQQRESKAIDQAENARAEGDKNVAAARIDFEKTSEDYRHTRWMDLADLDKKLIDMQAESRTATGKAKTDLDANLPAIRAQREAFVRDMEALDRATAANWDATKSNLDKEWNALKAAVDKAR
jgi:hypothetical protein